MKRLRCALVLLMAVLLLSPALAEDRFDLSEFEAYPAVFRIETNEERDIAFVDINQTAEELSFVHKYESEYYYSTIKNNLLVESYTGVYPLPILGISVTYHADEPLHIMGISFLLDGKEYLFDTLGVTDDVRQMEHGISEGVEVLFGSENRAFYEAVFFYALEYLYGYGDENGAPPEMKMVLHGTEDLEVTVPNGYWFNLGVFIEFLNRSDALGYISINEGTPVTVKELGEASSAA